jgi:periplasmic divalent cation tolerance protein
VDVDACQVTVSCGSEDEARLVADALLRPRLAACVQIVGPVESRYWWEGQLESATEWLCLAKSRLALVDAVVGAVRAVHSYDTPEVVATPIVAGDPAYLAWLSGSCSP